MSASDNINEEYGNQDECDESPTDGGEEEKNQNDMEVSDEWNNGEDDTFEYDSNDENKVDMFQAAARHLFKICCRHSLSSPHVDLSRMHAISPYCSTFAPHPCNLACDDMVYAPVALVVK